jgi:hypothetical protein
MAEHFEKVLTDAWQNIGEETYEITSDNFVGYEGPSWRIGKFTLKGGKQQGVDLVEIDNGHMTVVVIPTRGMGILEAFTDDVSLGWDSPVREVVHPAYVRPEERGGLGWLAGFNELVCRCGLSYNGAPGEDVIRTNTGAENRVMLPLHGTIANTPAAHVRVRVVKELAEERVEIEFKLLFREFDHHLRGAAAVFGWYVTPGSREYGDLSFVCAGQRAECVCRERGAIILQMFQRVLEIPDDAFTASHRSFNPMRIIPQDARIRVLEKGKPAITDWFS